MAISLPLNLAMCFLRFLSHLGRGWLFLAAPRPPSSPPKDSRDVCRLWLSPGRMVGGRRDEFLLYLLAGQHGFLFSSTLVWFSEPLRKFCLTLSVSLLVSTEQVQVINVRREVSLPTNSLQSITTFLSIFFPQLVPYLAGCRWPGLHPCQPQPCPGVWVSCGWSRAGFGSPMVMSLGGNWSSSKQDIWRHQTLHFTADPWGHLLSMVGVLVGCTVHHRPGAAWFVSYWRCF